MLHFTRNGFCVHSSRTASIPLRRWIIECWTTRWWCVPDFQYFRVPGRKCQEGRRWPHQEEDASRDCITDYAAATNHHRTFGRLHRLCMALPFHYNGTRLSRDFEIYPIVVCHMRLLQNVAERIYSLHHLRHACIYWNRIYYLSQVVIWIYRMCSI